jgi:FkbM family methyltransferase
VREETLIYDVGMNNGQDSAFYMHKGYRVVAIEANPVLCERARQEFSNKIQSGQLTILNVAISEIEGELDFYVNLDNDHWSSLDPDWGTRDNTRFETIKIQSVSLSRGSSRCPRVVNM